MKEHNKKERLYRWLFIFTGCWIFAFDYNFNESDAHWLWEGREQVAMYLGFVTIIFGVLWKLEQHKGKTIRE